MMPASERLLLIFVKHPRPGQVKTRLAEGIGAEKALQVYEELLAFTQGIAAAADADKAVWYGNEVPEADRWAETGWPRFLQQGPDLGARMSHAFEWGFGQGYRHIAIIGSDCAQLSAELLNVAFFALRDWPFVLGPALDGGYYLLGMSALFPPLFEGKAWSSAEVLTQTLAELREAGQEYLLLPPLSDVDVAEDLRGTFLEKYLGEG
jgi:hypothetical protein